MPDSSKDGDSVRNFKRNTSDYLRRLRRTGRPIVLSVRGKDQIIVQDAVAYQEMLAAAELASTVQFIKKGRADIRAGRTTPMREAVNRLGKK